MNKKQLTELLGMPLGTAERKLRKRLVHELARQLGKNFCFNCHVEIDDPEDFSVVHIEEWRDSSSYFDLTNVAFSHASCQASRQDRRQGEPNMERVKVTVEDAEGRPLRGRVHEGHLYVAGEKDQRYQVRVRNRTGNRICVVVTVDGRNVNNGEKGSWGGSGLVLAPHQEWVFKGWRQSNDRVAAFRLGAKENSYSAQMGTPENAGIIGVAVFEEAVRPKVVPAVAVPVLPPPWVPNGTSAEPWPWPRETIVSVTGFPADSDDPVRSATTASAKVGRSHQRLCSKSRAGGSSAVAHTQELGTEYGESLSSHVGSTTFLRASVQPCEIHLIRYDSLQALIAAGIMDNRPAPQAFPESPEVGFCPPPPQQRWK